MAELTETLPFTFNEIYTDIKSKFAEKGYDVAEGSNTSMLIDSMAYMITSLNTNTALNVNETILNYANREDNVLEDARSIGYESTKPTSFVYEVTVKTDEFSTEDYPDGGIVVIPKFSEFTYGDKTYYYVGEQLILRNLHEAQEVKLRLKEGILTKYTDDPDTLQVVIDKVIDNGVEIDRYYIDIPYTDVENDGIQCLCSYYDDFGVFYDKVEYTKSQTTMFESDDDLNKKFIRIDNIDYKTPRVYFRYAGMGKGLKLGSEVYFNILQTSGSQGEIADLTDTEGLSFDIKGISVESIELIQSGSDGETLQEIKDNAPKYYNSSNRLVTANDYISACQRDSRVRRAIVWGGEDEFPMSPGHIWFSFFPTNLKRSFTMSDHYMLWNRDYQANTYIYGSDEDQDSKATEYYNANYISDTEIRSITYAKDGSLLNPGIWDNIDTLNIPTLTYHNRHPIYCYFEYEIEILKYLLSDRKEDIHSEIFKIIDGMFSGETSSLNYENYDVEYFKASVIKYIDERVTDVSGFNLYQKNKLVLNTRTLCAEHENYNYRDLYIPLAVPYESYFEDGFLKIDMLPNIDTENFIQYRAEQGRDLYVDWSLIQEDINNGITQENHKLIIAPVRVKYNSSEAFTNKEYRKIQFKTQIIADDLAQTEEDKTYNATHLYYYTQDEFGNDEKIEISYDTDELGSGWYLDNKDPSVVHFGSSLELDEINEIFLECNQFCGFYYLFNSYKKEILIHLFIDASTSGLLLYTKGEVALMKDNYLYSLDEKYLFSNTEHYLVSEEQITTDTKYIETIDTTPRSYLYSNDVSYLNSTDSYYLTTNGYALDNPNAVSIYSGPVVREINENMYLRSPLKADLFFRNRYLNLKYPSDSFKTLRNVIPMLKSVKFKDILD